MNLSSTFRIPVMTAGTFALMNWYLPDLAAALVDLQPLSVIATLVLVSGAVFLGEIAPTLVDA